MHQSVDRSCFVGEGKKLPEISRKISTPTGFAHAHIYIYTVEEIVYIYGWEFLVSII